MTPQELRARAEALHGTRWQTALAKQVGCSPRAMRNYAAGSRAIPEPTARLIRLLHWNLGHAIEVPEHAILAPG